MQLVPTSTMRACRSFGLESFKIAYKEIVGDACAMVDAPLLDHVTMQDHVLNVAARQFPVHVCSAIKTQRLVNVLHYFVVRQCPQMGHGCFPTTLGRVHVPVPSVKFEDEAHSRGVAEDQLFA